MTLSARPAQLLQLPLPEGTGVRYPEATVLRVDIGFSVDVGALCYQKRSPRANVGAQGQTGTKAERLVDQTTLDSSRIAPILGLITYLSEQIHTQSQRPTTVAAAVSSIVGLIDWADQQSLPFPLADAAAAKATLASYVSYLRELVKLGRLANNSAAKAQLQVIRVLQELVSGSETLTHGLNLLQIQKHSTKSTEPPTEVEQGRVLALARCLFEGLSDLVLNNRPYPYALSIPASLAAKDNVLWVFPSRKWCMPPHELTAREALKKGYWAFDYENGRIAEVEEIQDRYFYNPSKQTKTASAEFSIRNAEASMHTANSDPQHGYRRNAALSAHNAFVIQFLANTGMNWSSIKQLAWETGEMDISVERQGFRTIKYRAKGRTVSFEIQPVFLPLFKTFLRVRKYLLNDQQFDHLFLGSGNFVKTISPLFPGTLKSIVANLRDIDPSLPSIMSKQWRAGKSDWLLRHTDPATAALVLQNSELTVLRAYAEGSHTNHTEEFGTFFAKLEETVLPQGTQVEESVDSALGICCSHGHPHQIQPSPIPVNCGNPEGCLFCEHFKVHADERDTRKLISCQYCLEQVSRMAGSQEQFETLFSPIFERIDYLLAEIGKKSDGLVERVRSDVLEGELDPYWAGKLEMLIELKVVS